MVKAKENDVTEVHIGHAIDKRRTELNISKSEFGRRIGVSQQHVNRILERETMETSKLVKVCHALEYNFFSLFCPTKHHISAQLAAVAIEGEANNIISDSALSAQILSLQTEIEHLKDTINLLKEQKESLNEQIKRLDSNLKDKDVIIALLRDQNQ